MAKRFVVAALAAALCSSACTREDNYRPDVSGGDPARGRIALRTHDCGACHVIPGVRAARGHVGPTLEAYSRRVYVAGKFPNTPQYLVRWIRDAPAMWPQTAMPAFPIDDGDARDMAAYLYTLD